MKLKWKQYCQGYSNQRLVGYGMTLFNALGLYDSKKERTEWSWRSSREKYHDDLDLHTRQFHDEDDELDIMSLCHLYQFNVQFFNKSRTTKSVELVDEFVIRDSLPTVTFQITRQAYESNNFNKLALVTKKEFFNDSTSSFFECLEVFTKQSALDLETALGKSTISLCGKEEKLFYDCFNFGFEVYRWKGLKKAYGKVQLERLYKSKYDNYVCLVLKRDMIIDDEDIVIGPSDKLRLLNRLSYIVYRCENNHCGYNTNRKSNFDRHVINCGKETKVCAKQVNYTSQTPREWLIEQGLLKQGDHMKHIICYDIETVMVPKGNEKKGEKTEILSKHVIGIVSVSKNFGAEPRNVTLRRKDFTKDDSKRLMREFKETIDLFQKEKLTECTQKELFDAFNTVNQRLGDRNTSPEIKANLWNARYYLNNLLATYVFGYNSQKYDMPIVFAGVLQVYLDAGYKCTTIKTGAGIMRATYTKANHQVIFGDVMRFTAGGTLDQFNSTWIPEHKKHEVKGTFPYELFQDIDSIKACKEWPRISDFKSSLNFNKSVVKDPLQAIKKASEIVENIKDPDMRAYFQSQFAYKLCLGKYFVGLTNYDWPINFSAMKLKDNVKAHHYPLDPVLYVDNWILYQKELFTKQLSRLFCPSETQGQFSQQHVNNLWDFYALYCQIDSKLLCDAFTAYIDSFITLHDVNPLENYSLPMMASQIVWKEFDNEKNAPYSIGPDHTYVSQFIRENIMGGISTVYHRHAEVGTERRYDSCVHETPNGKPIKKIEVFDFNSKFFLIRAAIQSYFRPLWPRYAPRFTHWSGYNLQEDGIWVCLAKHD